MFSRKNFCSISLVLFSILCCLRGYCFDTEADITLDIKAPQFSDLSDEQKMLISEFGAKYCLLVKFYENVRIDAELLSPDSSAQNNVKYVFRARGGNHFRMDTFHGIKPEDALPKEGNEILFVTPSLYSAIERSSPADEFYVSGIQTKDVFEAIGDYTKFRFWRAPYCTWFLPVKYCVFMKPGFADHFKVSQLTQRKEDTNDLVTIETQYYKEGKIAVVGTFTFYRNLCWALKETKWELIPDNEIRYSFVEYSGEEKGIPLLSKVTYWHTDSSDSTPVSQIAQKDVFVCDVTTAPIPYSEFDVGQYVNIGLPESNHSHLFLRLSLVLLGIVFIVWGLALRLRKK